MTRNLSTKLEYGDFQTPLELAILVCQQLITLGINPDIIVEPTCGVGSFIEASLGLFPSVEKIIGVEINQEYLKNNQLISKNKVELYHADFFQFDWLSCLKKIDKKVLILGNFPWITNSRQGNIGGNNLPQKTNFQNYNGLDAITGKSNFDVSEWMLIQVIQWLQGRDAYLAMLCKTSVSRKLLTHLYSKNLNIAEYATYRIDTKKYFDADVEACLLFCKFDSISKNYFCNVFSALGSSKHYKISYKNNVLIKDIAAFEKLSKFYDLSKGEKWRSGIKHDCSKIMEFRKHPNNILTNGLGELVNIEETYLFPLMKGSDVAQDRIKNIEKYVLVTQKFVGESTENIRKLAPKTWDYLESHGNYLDNRKSRIHKNNYKFSIFGVGSYTFTNWKIGICGLYKKLEFRLIGSFNDKPIIFDDTIYFLSFNDEKTARKTFDLLTSPLVIDFYSSLIFWDEKRPIKASILNSLNLTALLAAKL